MTRAPLLSFSNTDMAFAGDVLVAGSYHGFNIYRLPEGGLPKLVSSVVCPGGQGDVSIVGDLLIMSVEQTRGRLDCGLQGVSEDVSTDRFRGIRIFDISDLTRPLQVGAVQTCRGSHTHSVVSGPRRRRQDHRLQLRHFVRTRRRGDGRLHRRIAWRRKNGAVSHRRHRNPGRRASEGAHRQQPHRVRRS